MNRRSRFIVLEGGEGAGKSTHLASIAGWLEARGRHVLCTREPGGSPLAEAIRRVVLEPWEEGVDATTELLLMFAARAAHLHATIGPALAAGTDIVCDRFVDASYAYQGGGRGIDPETIGILERIVLKSLRPDLVLVLDLPEETGLRRAMRRGALDRFEKEDQAFRSRVRQAYLARARSDPQRYAVVDAGQPPEVVADTIVRVLEQRL